MAHITLEDLLSEQTRRHPFAFFGKLREQEPLCYIPASPGFGGAWLATTYEDVSAILKDSRFIRDAQKLASTEPGDSQSISETPTSPAQLFSWKKDMISVDPPDHTRLRSLVSRAFTPRIIEQRRSRIQQIADELLDAVEERGQMDIIADFAYLLPITVILEMVGIPVEDQQQFRTWSQSIVNDVVDPQKFELVAANIDAFLRYLRALLLEKRTHPGNDLISDLIKVEENGDMLSENELISAIFLLVVAGHETTMNLIGNAILALLHSPAQMSLLRQDPSLMPVAIEELLRYTAAVSITDRWASEDIQMREQVIRKGEMIFVSLVGANTDPEQFSTPELLSLTRQENQHLAFGRGIHYCLGAPLARLEGQIALGTLLRRFPDLRLVGDAEQLNWNRAFALRGLLSLPVTF